MPGPGTFLLGGPVSTGTVMGSPPSKQGDFGLCELVQRLPIAQNSTNAVSATFLIPPSSTILNFDVDVLTQFNSATSAIMTIGTAAAGTQYVTSVDCKAAAGRIALTYTAAQLTSMNNVGANTTVVATVTPVGATSAGSVLVTMRYLHTVNLAGGIL
jgi:hypothetical protein